MKLLQEHPLAAAVAALLIVAVAVSGYLMLSAGLETDEQTSTGTTATGIDSVQPATDGNGAATGNSAGSGTVTGRSPGADVEGLLGGEVEKLPALQGDINGDGEMETVILGRGAGETKPLDWFLVGSGGDGATVLFSREGVVHGEVTIDGPRIVEVEAVYGPGDEPCCPAALKKTIYVWRDDGLVVSRIEAVPGGAPAP